MELIRAKRGDTFRLACVWTDVAGDPVTLSGVTIASQLKGFGSTITLGSAKTDEGAGEFQLTADAATTEAWVPGVYKCDVEFTSGVDGVMSSETFLVEIVEDVTIDA